MPGINAEIAAELIRSGEAYRIAQEKRLLARERNEIFASFFPETDTAFDSLFQWVRLPESQTGALCEAKLAKRGVSVLGAERFSVGADAPPTSSALPRPPPHTSDELVEGLTALRDATQDTAPDYALIV